MSAGKDDRLWWAFNVLTGSTPPRLLIGYEGFHTEEGATAEARFGGWHGIILMLPERPEALRKTYLYIDEFELKGAERIVWLVSNPGEALAKQIAEAAELAADECLVAAENYRTKAAEYRQMGRIKLPGLKED